MTGPRPRQRLAGLTDRAFDRLRSPAAFALTEEAAVHGDLRGLAGHPYAVLVTFRSGGAPVPSPVWLAVSPAGSVYVKTAQRSGKVVRLRRDPRALLAPSDRWGAPLGPAIRVVGRLLQAEQWSEAERALANAYGGGRRLAERLGRALEDSPAYIELRPRA